MGDLSGGIDKPPERLTAFCLHHVAAHAVMRFPTPAEPVIVHFLYPTPTILW